MNSPESTRLMYLNTEEAPRTRGDLGSSTQDNSIVQVDGGRGLKKRSNALKSRANIKQTKFASIKPSAAIKGSVPNEKRTSGKKSDEKPSVPPQVILKLCLAEINRLRMELMFSQNKRKIQRTTSEGEECGKISTKEEEEESEDEEFEKGEETTSTSEEILESKQSSIKNKEWVIFDTSLDIMREVIEEKSVKNVCGTPEAVEDHFPGRQQVDEKSGLTKISFQIFEEIESQQRGEDDTQAKKESALKSKLKFLSEDEVDLLIAIIQLMRRERLKRIAEQTKYLGRAIFPEESFRDIDDDIKSKMLSEMPGTLDLLTPEDDADQRISEFLITESEEVLEEPNGVCDDFFKYKDSVDSSEGELSSQTSAETDKSSSTVHTNNIKRMIKLKKELNKGLRKLKRDLKEESEQSIAENITTKDSTEEEELEEEEGGEEVFDDEEEDGEEEKMKLEVVYDDTEEDEHKQEEYFVEEESDVEKETVDEDSEEWEEEDPGRPEYEDDVNKLKKEVKQADQRIKYIIKQITSMEDRRDELSNVLGSETDTERKSEIEKWVKELDEQIAWKKDFDLRHYEKLKRWKEEEKRRAEEDKKKLKLPDFFYNYLIKVIADLQLQCIEETKNAEEAEGKKNCPESLSPNEKETTRQNMEHSNESFLNQCLNSPDPMILYWLLNYFKSYRNSHDKETCSAEDTRTNMIPEQMSSEEYSQDEDTSSGISPLEQEEVPSWISTAKGKNKRKIQIVHI